jgi:hypothetical protein
MSQLSWPLVSGYAGARPVRVGNAPSVSARTMSSAPSWTRSCSTLVGTSALSRRLWPIVESQAACSLESSGDFDAEPGLSRVKTKVFAVNFADDEFYRDSLQTLQRDMRAVRGGRFVVRAVSDGSVGHMSMAEPALWADQARDFVAWLSEN